MKRIATWLTPIAVIGFMAPAMAHENGGTGGQGQQAQQQHRMQHSQGHQQGHQQGHNQGHNQGQPQGQQQAQQLGRNTIVGDLVDTHDVTLKGEAGNKHKLLKLDVEGKNVIVDLGQVKEKNFEALDLDKGDRLWATGNNARINDKPVIYARYIGEVLPFVPQIIKVGREQS